MTVTVQAPLKVYTAAAGATVFPYDFKIFEAADLYVAVDGVQVSNYTVSGAGSATGGNVTFLSSMAGGEQVVIDRNVLDERETNYQEGGDLLGLTHNDDHDRPILLAQQLKSRALQVPVGDTAGGSMILPSVDDRKNKTAGYDGAGSPTAFDPSGGPLTDGANVNVVSALGISRTLQDKSLDIVSNKDAGITTAKTKTANAAAMAAVIASSIAILAVAPGTYASEKWTVTRQIIINGSGADYSTGGGLPAPNATIFEFADNSGSIDIDQSAGINGIENVQFSNFTIRCKSANAATTPYAVKIGNTAATGHVSSCSFWHINVENYTATNAKGWNVLKCLESTWYDCNARNNFDNYYIGGATCSNTTLTFLRCRSDVATNRGWVFFAPSGQTNYGHVLINCVGQSCQKEGLYLYGSGTFALVFIAYHSEDNNRGGAANANLFSGSGVDGNTYSHTFTACRFFDTVPVIAFDYANYIAINDPIIPGWTSGVMSCTANTFGCFVKTKLVFKHYADITGSDGDNVRLVYDLGFSRVRSGDTVGNIANDAEITIPWTTGFVMIEEALVHKYGVFGLQGASNTVESLGANAIYSTTYNNATTINVAHNGAGSYVVQNKTGGAINIDVKHPT